MSKLYITIFRSIREKFSAFTGTLFYSASSPSPLSISSYFPLSFKFALIFSTLKNPVFATILYLTSPLQPLSEITFTLLYYYSTSHPLNSSTQCFFPHHSTETILSMMSNKFLSFKSNGHKCSATFDNLDCLLPLRHSLSLVSMVTRYAVSAFSKYHLYAHTFHPPFGVPIFPLICILTRACFSSHSTILLHDSSNLLF